ncbi:FAD/NAD(P)-binding domain-containing protein [Rostrohypoxylon terebratum]|nr:FAD/NAD(P)-binding domain-containing protein [Rostrohypoxylon terebratum]
MPQSTQDMDSTSKSVDVVIVGAGVSGINAAYQLITDFPGIQLTILEARDDVGGTWDLFRYPGVRSDTALPAYDFTWHPWSSPNPVAEGPLIKKYLKDCASQHGVSQYIRFQHKVLSADWSQDAQRWTMTVSHKGLLTDITARFLVLGSGYYSYHTPFRAEIPGLENFKGDVIHPQFWPEDYKHEDKKIAVVGSGATTISLFPALVKTASRVTIVQRSPSYVISTAHLGPPLSPLLEFLHIPPYIRYRLERLWIIILHAIVAICTTLFPAQSRAFMRKITIPQLPKWCDHDVHFKPKYNPWDQRLCMCPDGDFFQALHKPNAGIVTGHIDTVTESSIKMQDGTVIDVDTIVTATGITMKLGGDIDISVNGKKMKWEDKLIWNGCMLSGVPNMVFIMGYTTYPWTVGTDIVMRVLLRLLRLMKSKGYKTAVPQLPKEGVHKTERMWQLDSSYSMRAESSLPRYGTTGPWKPKTWALLDDINSRWGSITKGLEFTT